MTADELKTVGFGIGLARCATSDLKHWGLSSWGVKTASLGRRARETPMA